MYNLLQKCDVESLDEIHKTYRRTYSTETNILLKKIINDTIDKLELYQIEEYAPYVEKIKKYTFVNSDINILHTIQAELYEVTYKNILSNLAILAKTRLVEDPNEYNSEGIDDLDYQDHKQKTHAFILNNSSKFRSFHELTQWRVPVDVFRLYSHLSYGKLTDGDFTSLRRLDNDERVLNFWKTIVKTKVSIEEVCRAVIKKSHPTLYRDAVKVMVCYVIQQAKCKNTDFGLAVILSYYCELIVKYDYGGLYYYFAYLKGEDNRNNPNFYIVRRASLLESKYDKFAAKLEKSGLVREF